MTKNSPIVPTNAWKAGLIATYAPVLDALGATAADVSTQNDGSVYVAVETTPEAIEAADAFPLSERPTKRGWHIVTPAGMEYAATHHPSEGRAEPKQAKRELSPEEQRRADMRKQLRDQLNQIKSDQQVDAEEEDDDENEE
jgi:hypothetical protein